VEVSPLQTDSFCIIHEKPKIIELRDEIGAVGKVEEFTSKSTGAVQANVTDVTLWGPFFLHHHKISEETYICSDGEGEVFLDGQIIEFGPGVRVIVKPGTVHAARPKKGCEKLVYLTVTAPAEDPSDNIFDPRGRAW